MPKFPRTILPALRVGSGVQAEVCTLESLHNRWKLTKHYRKLGPQGRSGYDLAWTKQLASLASMPVQDITFEDYQAILDTMAYQGYSRSAQEKVQQLISQLNQMAVREDMVKRNLAPDLVLEGVAPKETRPFDDCHIPLLLEYSKSSDSKYQQAAQITLCLIFTGFRPEELFAIRCEYMNPQEPFLVSGSKTAAGKNRMVPILSIVYPFIAHWYLSCPMVNHQKQGFLIRGPKGGQKNLHNWRAREFYPMTLELGINRPDQLTSKRQMPHITPYSARHTFATLAYRAGVDKEALKKIIGHASLIPPQNFTSTPRPKPYTAKPKKSNPICFMPCNNSARRFVALKKDARETRTSFFVTVFHLPGDLVDTPSNLLADTLTKRIGGQSFRFLYFFRLSCWPKYWPIKFGLYGFYM